MSAASSHGKYLQAALGCPHDKTLGNDKKMNTAIRRSRCEEGSCNCALTGPARLPKRPIEGEVKWQHIQEGGSAAALSQ